MKKIFTIFILTTLYFILNTSIFAVTTTISNIPAVISADLFIFDVVISGASAGTNYLRIDLFKPTTTNYFGETFNGLSWFNGSDYLQYFPITIQPMTDWIGQIQGRLGNPTVIQYDGPGTYKLKVRRYTPSGSYNTTEANNSALDIIINVPILTPTPVITPTDIPTSAPTETLISTPTPTLPAEVLTEAGSLILIYYNNIFLSEVMVNPASDDKEWVEIYNNNDFPVSLNNWFIDDLENDGSTPKIFSLEIGAKSYGVFDITSSIFNNGGDTVRLLDFNKNLKDDFEYQKTEQGKTLGRTSFDSDYFCLQKPSKNSVNNSCINPSPTPNTLTPTEKIILSSTIKNVPSNIPITKTNNVDVSTLKSINYPTGAFQNNSENGNVLGIKDEIIINSPNNKSLINLLCFLSIFYSFLSIVSILIKSKVLNKYAMAS